jgi:Fe2+ transport system protein FeoA
MLSLSDREKRIPGEGRSKPLSAVEAGKKVYIVAVDSGQGLKGRLAAMGLVPGVPVDVILNAPRGPFIVAVKGSRVMLGRGMAGKIIVV